MLLDANSFARYLYKLDLKVEESDEYVATKKCEREIEALKDEADVKCDSMDDAITQVEKALQKSRKMMEENNLEIGKLAETDPKRQTLIRKLEDLEYVAQSEIYKLIASKDIIKRDYHDQSNLLKVKLQASLETIE